MNPTPTAPTPPKPADSNIPGFNALLMGPAGTGKTYSIGTLADAGIEVFFLAIESGYESVVGYWTDAGKPIPDNFHWHKLKAPEASFLELLDSANKINTMSLENVAKMNDPNRHKHNQFIALLNALNNFIDDRTGQSYGSVMSWGVDRAIVIDGLTGIGHCAMSLVIGGKPVRNQSDWGIAQDQVEKVVRMLCDACRCHFVLLSHVERETDTVLGGVKLMVSTLGKALAPKFPSMFSDVILTSRQGSKWAWDTASPMADLKTRNLPIAANIEPDFKQIVAKWRSRAQIAE